MKRLTLAAHYDSLYRPEGFIGAVDSAAPCAVLMAVARGVNSGLTKRWEGAMTRRKEMVDSSGLEEEEEEEDEDIKGVQIVLFDGEEAWERWTSTDSTYGSRYVVTAPAASGLLLLLLLLVSAVVIEVKVLGMHTNKPIIFLGKKQSTSRSLGILALRGLINPLQPAGIHQPARTP